MFLAWMKLAGQNVCLSWLFGTQGTSSHVVMINSAGTRGPTGPWALGLRSGRACQGERWLLGKALLMRVVAYTWPERRGHAGLRWGGPRGSPGSPQRLAYVVRRREPHKSMCVSLAPLLSQTPRDTEHCYRTLSFVGKRRPGSRKFHVGNSKSVS